MVFLNEMEEVNVATENTNHSLGEKNASNRDYTYSELGRLTGNLKDL